MKTIDKVICIEQRDYINITKGNLYTLDNIYRETENLYWIIDDFGNLRGLSKYLFITIEEHREQQLNKVLE